MRVQSRQVVVFFVTVAVAAAAAAVAVALVVCVARVRLVQDPGVCAFWSSGRPDICLQVSDTSRQPVRVCHLLLPCDDQFPEKNMRL